MVALFWILFSLFVGLAIWMFVNLVLWDRARWQERKIIARCEEQHRQWMAGSPHGFYGLYPPPANWWW